MSRSPGPASTGTRPSTCALPRPLPAPALQGVDPRLARAARALSTDALDRGAPGRGARGLHSEPDASLARAAGDPHQRVHGADGSLLPRRGRRLPAGPGAGRRRPGRAQLLDRARVLAGGAGRAAHADRRRRARPGGRTAGTRPGPPRGWPAPPAAETVAALASAGQGSAQVLLGHVPRREQVAGRPRLRTARPARAPAPRAGPGRPTPRRRPGTAAPTTPRPPGSGWR